MSAIIMKYQWRNGNAMFNGQSKSTILKPIQCNASIVWNTAFWEDANAQAAFYTPVGFFHYSAFTSHILSIYKNTGAFIEKSEYWNFRQFLFTYKYKRSRYRIVHQHNVEHRTMVRNEHETLFVRISLFLLNVWKTSHAI